MYYRGVQVLVDGAHCLGSVKISMRYTLSYKTAFSVMTLIICMYCVYDIVVYTYSTCTCVYTQRELVLCILV